MTDRARAPGRRGFVRPLLADRGGNVSVELALLTPILLLVFLGLVEYGRAYTEQLNLGRVTRAQLQYAVENLGTSTVLDEIDGLSHTMPNGDTVTFAASRTFLSAEFRLATCRSNSLSWAGVSTSTRPTITRSSRSGAGLILIGITSSTSRRGREYRMRRPSLWK